jgi:hypothetical protein
MILNRLYWNRPAPAKRTSGKGLLALGVLLALLPVYPSTLVAEQPVVAISEMVWSDNVDQNKNPVKRYGEKISGAKQLCLWTRIQGKEDAFAYLKKKGQLPIQHQWFIYVGPNPHYEDTLQTDEVKLNVGEKGVLDKLGWQVKNTGYFEWRTWSRKVNVRPGWWRVKIIYSDGNSVSCEGGVCESVIKVE